jgi:hypothetical protein
MTNKKTVRCDECGRQVKQTIQCIPGCDMWLCVDCTISSPKHDSNRGEHWEMLAKSHNIDLSEFDEFL